MTAPLFTTDPAVRNRTRWSWHNEHIDRPRLRLEDITWEVITETPWQAERLTEIDLGKGPQLEVRSYSYDYDLPGVLTVIYPTRVPDWAAIEYASYDDCQGGYLEWEHPGV